MMPQQLCRTPRPTNDNVRLKLSLDERLYHLASIAGKIRSYKFNTPAERVHFLHALEIELGLLCNDAMKSLNYRMSKIEFIKDKILKERMNGK